VNGIPTGTTYTLAFGDSKSEAVEELKGKKIIRTSLANCGERFVFDCSLSY
jgi:hypothetical protein